MRRNFLPIFIEICMEPPWAPQKLHCNNRAWFLSSTRKWSQKKNCCPRHKPGVGMSGLGIDRAITCNTVSRRPKHIMKTNHKQTRVELWSCSLLVYVKKTRNVWLENLVSMLPPFWVFFASWCNSQFLTRGELSLRRTVFVQSAYTTYLHNTILQSVLEGSLHKNNTCYLLLGLYHASVNKISIVLMQITPKMNGIMGFVQVNSPLQKRERNGTSFLYWLDWKSKHFNWNVAEWKATQSSLRVFSGKLSKREPCKSCKIPYKPLQFFGLSTQSIQNLYFKWYLKSYHFAIFLS